MLRLSTVLRHSLALRQLGAPVSSQLSTSVVTETQESGRLPGRVGLEFDPQWRTTLRDLYKETLTAVEKVPSDAVYRSNVEKVTKYRLKVVDEEGEKGVDEVEKMLGVGPIEEVIEQAKDELNLIPEMVKWQPWKTEDGKEPIKIEIID